MFTAWAGISPKKFLQYLSLEYAKSLISRQNSALNAATYDTGLSSTSRLHDLFINIESMTPAEYRDGGSNLQIGYSFEESPFGQIIIASTERGICYAAFEENRELAVKNLRQQFPNASFHNSRKQIHADAINVLNQSYDAKQKLPLHLKGTPFQLKVWESLLKIPAGQLSSYKYIAEQIGSPSASRAVGSAIGQNPIAYLIPCHRVIQSSGAIGGYMWGAERKAAIIGWESAKLEHDYAQ